MLSHDFQSFLTFVLFLLIAGLIFFGFYCRQKSNSYAGTGKVAEIEAWHLKSIITWIATFGLSLFALVSYI